MTPNISFSHFSWRQSKLGNLAEIGSSVRVHESDWTSQGIPFIRARDIVASNNQVLQPEIYISESLFNELSKRSYVLKGDVLVTGVGTIGVPYLVKEGDKFYYKDGNIIYIRSNGEIHPEFLYHYMHSYNFKKHLRSISGCGTVATYTIKNAKDTPIFFPSIEEQQKIASFFSTLDEKITLVEKKISILECLKRGMLFKFFNNKDITIEHLGSIVEIIDSVRVPCEEWRSKGIPYIRAKDFNDNLRSIELYISEERFVEYKNRTGAPEKGDVIFVSGGNIGFSFYIKDDDPIYLQGGSVLCIKTSSSKRLRGDYLHYFMQSSRCKNFIESHATGGTIKHFTIGPAKNIPVPFLSIQDQEKIARTLACIDEKIENQKNKLSLLLSLKKGLMYRMFI